MLTCATSAHFVSFGLATVRSAGWELLERSQLQAHDVPLITPGCNGSGRRPGWLGGATWPLVRAQPCHHLCLNAAAERAFVQNRLDVSAVQGLRVAPFAAGPAPSVGVNRQVDWSDVREITTRARQHDQWTGPAHGRCGDRPATGAGPVGLWILQRCAAARTGHAAGRAGADRRCGCPAGPSTLHAPHCSSRRTVALARWPHIYGIGRPLGVAHLPGALHDIARHRCHRPTPPVLQAQPLAAQRPTMDPFLFAPTTTTPTPQAMAPLRPPCRCGRPPDRQRLQPQGRRHVPRRHRARFSLPGHPHLGL